MIDIAIIGGGPAGLSAALNAAARNKKAVVFSRKKESSALWQAEAVNNHLGMPGLSGEKLAETFLSHAVAAGIEIRTGRILQILQTDAGFALQAENDLVEAKTVILATGVAKGKQIEGEADYLGKGVSYCATCDGMLYKGKDVIVVAETEEGVEDANFLAEICHKVYYTHTRGAETEPKLNPAIERLRDTVSRVVGDDFVTAVEAGGARIPVDGAFFIKATPPLNSLIFGLETTGHAVAVNRAMETNIKGLFACGDITGKPFQLSKAIGEGQIAGQSAAAFVSRISGNQ